MMPSPPTSVAAAEWVCGFVRGAGGTCELVETRRHPLAVGEIPASASFRNGREPTILVYGHFDVQPPGAEADWSSPPFEPEIRDGWLYGRGVADDKGNLYLLLKAVEALSREGALPVNVRVACDGEEEVIGTSIVELLQGDERGADACLIYDGAMPRRGLPFFFVGTRGLVYYHVAVTTGAHDLHSGFYGGAAMNATHVLIELLSAVSSTPQLLRAGAVPPTEEEVEAWAELDPGAAVLADQGATPADRAAAEEFYARTLAAPAVDVHGLKGGEPDLQKTVLPVMAEANVSIRLAPGQEVEEVATAFERLIGDATPEGADVKLTRRSSSPAGLVDPALGSNPDRTRRFRGGARSPARPRSVRRYVAYRPCARGERDPSRPHRLRCPGRERPRAERTASSRVHAARVRGGAADTRRVRRSYAVGLKNAATTR